MGLATRIICTLLYDEHGCVKGRGFNPGRRIGSVKDRLRVLERRDIDELVLLDISATRNNRAPRYEAVAGYTDGMFCPVTVGGGIRSVADAVRLIQGGADKVAIGTALSSSLLAGLAEKIGRQSVVAAIDVKAGTVWRRCASEQTIRRPAEMAQLVERDGAGEILLTDIERDGTMQGYDLDLISEVSSAVGIPVIANGGCGSYEHMLQAIDAGAHAVAAGALWQFTDSTPKEAARYLKAHGILTRT